MPFYVNQRFVTTSLFQEGAGLSGYVGYIHEYETDVGGSYYEYAIVLDECIDVEGLEECRFYAYEDEIEPETKIRKRKKSGFGMFVERLDKEDRECRTTSL